MQARQVQKNLPNMARGQACWGKAGKVGVVVVSQAKVTHGVGRTSNGGMVKACHGTQTGRHSEGVCIVRHVDKPPVPVCAAGGEGMPWVNEYNEPVQGAQGAQRTGYKNHRNRRGNERGKRQARKSTGNGNTTVGGSIKPTRGRGYAGKVPPWQVARGLHPFPLG